MRASSLVLINLFKMSKPKKSMKADFVCLDCKHEFGITLNFGGKTRKTCPSCMSKKIRGKKTWTPEKVKSERVVVNLGWHDDVDELATDEKYKERGVVGLDKHKKKS